MGQVNELLEIFQQTQVTRVGVAIDFVQARVQPCKERDHPAYLYHEEEDGTQEASELVSDEVLLARVGSFFTKGTG